MDIEEKILIYFYEIFPDVQTFSRNLDLLEELGLDAEKDLLEFEKAIDVKDYNDIMDDLRYFHKRCYILKRISLLLLLKMELGKA